MQEETTRASALIPKTEHLEIRRWALDHGRSLQDIIVEALREWKERHMTAAQIKDEV